MRVNPVNVSGKKETRRDFKAAMRIIKSVWPKKVNFFADAFDKKDGVPLISSTLLLG